MSVPWHSLTICRGYPCGSRGLKTTSRLFFTPEKIVSAEGKIEHDSASVKVKFADAPKLQIIASCLGKVKTRKLTIVGDKATAILDETLEKNKLAITKNGQTTNPQINFRPPLRNELEHFIYCIQTGAAPLTNVDFGYRITEWLEEISVLLTNKR